MTAALVASAPAVARAQDTEDAEILKQAKEHYRLGTEAFKAAKYPEAIKEMKRAYLLKHLPPLLKNIAQCYEHLNDLDMAIYYYKKYLAEAPPDAKDREQVKQALEELQAKKAGAGAQGGGDEQTAEASRPGGQPAAAETPAPPRQAPEPKAEPAAQPEAAATPPRKAPKKQVEAAEPPPPEAAPPRPTKPPPDAEAEAPAPRPRSTQAPSEWAHTPIDAAPPGVPLDVKVQSPVMKGVKVYLYYRGQGEADFTKVLMKRHGAEKVGQIPAAAMAGKSIQYYIEAKDETGNVVKSAGTQVDPNIVFLDPSAPAQYSSRGRDEAESESSEGPPPAATRAGKRSRCDEHPLECEEQEAQEAPAKKSGPLFTALGWAGFGVIAGGIGLGAGGLYMGLKASSDADTIAQDASDPTCRSRLGINKAGGLCYFNNANDIKPTDLDLQNEGKTFGIVGPVLAGVGGAMIVGGAAMVVVDYLKHHRSTSAKSAKSAPPKPKKAPKRPAKSDGAPPEESSLIHDLIIVPTINPTTVGLGAGFRF